jgi:hypothetical protein
MARHANPRTIARLDAVLRAKQTAAEAALADARDDEALACAEAEMARGELAASQNLWLDYLGRPAFAPEFARAIAGQVVASDGAAKEAGERHGDAIDRTERHVEEWQVAEARVRSTGRRLALARRAEAVRHEERRLADFADRVTFAWMMQ